jgi:hypothetical protein
MDGPGMSLNHVAWLFALIVPLVLLERWISRRVQNLKTRLLVFSWLAGAFLYGLMIYGFVFGKRLYPDFVRHFGDTPFGLPARVVLWLAISVLAAPLVYGMRYIVALSLLGAPRGYHGEYGLLAYAWAMRGNATLRPLLIRTILLMVYLVVMFAALAAGAVMLHRP